jgi:hypothetical protein
MHLIEVEEDQSGWFPAIGIRISRFSDLLLVLLTVGFCLVALFIALTTGRKLVGKAIHSAAILLLRLTVHAFTLLLESIGSIYHTVLRIPVPWYPTAALTMLPFAIDIPRWASIIYLLAYCTANAWIMACGITSRETKTHEPVASNAPKPPATLLHSQMFSGMRITIQS